MVKSINEIERWKTPIIDQCVKIFRIENDFDIEEQELENEHDMEEEALQMLISEEQNQL